MIMHIDANGFYAACERLFRPDLDGKPIAVLSNNDGVTIALNQECKQLGFARGDTFFKMRSEYFNKGVEVFSSNYTLYADMCSRLNLIYSEFCPDVELYSIDESFLKFPNWVNINFTQMGWEIKKKVWQYVHIPVSVGIAPTKTLAKFCNKLAKKRGGVFQYSEASADAELGKIETGDIWGIGSAKAKLLKRYGIFTALELKYYPLDRAKKNLTITGMKTVQELNCVPALDVVSSENRQNITTSKSFAKGVYSLSELETALSEYAQLAVTRMRQEKSACTLISIFIMTARAYKIEDKPKEYFNCATARLPYASSFLPDILETSICLLHTIYKTGYAYRKVMVNLLGLEPDMEIQLDLFQSDIAQTKKNQKALMLACDNINDKYGRGCLHLGTRNQTAEICKDGSKAAWLMERKYLSPQYTTNFNDLPVVR